MKLPSSTRVAKSDLISLCRRLLRVGEIVIEEEIVEESVEELFDNISPERAFPIAADEFHRSYHLM